MTVFYPYSQTKDDGLELKYSIRSMEKHFKDMTDVIVVGDLPTWYCGTYIFYKDIEKRKEYSVFRKLKTIHGTVLLCHDDVYALHPFDSDLPNYYRGTCKEAIDRTKERRFKDMFLSCPPDWLNFEIHCPMVMNTHLIEDEDRDFLLKTTYANRLKLTGTDIADCKLRGAMTRGEIMYQIKDRPFFSTADNCMIEVMNELYPDKSKYES